MENAEKDSFREQLRLLVRSLGILQKSESGDGAVTITQCHALVEIGRRGSISVTGLAALLCVDKSTMSRTIGHLCRAGLVRKDAGTSPGDRRVTTLHLTEKGLHAYQETEESAREHYGRVFASIPKDMQAQVLQSLAIVNEAFCHTTET